MTAKSLVRLSGIALLLSGILVTVGFFLHPHDSAGANGRLWLATHIVIMSGGFLNLLGVMGLYLASATRTKSTGLIGFLLSAAGLVLYLGKLYWSGFIYPLVVANDAELIRLYGLTPGSEPVEPVVKAVFYLGPVLFAVGYAALGFSLLRARAYPAAAIWTAVVGAALAGLWPVLPAVVQHLSVPISAVYAFGIAWIGYLLARGKPIVDGLR